MKKESQNTSKIDKELFDAINEDDLEEVKRLVKNGANVNARFSGSLTPLMMAVNAPKNKFDMMIYLIKNGADVFAKDDNGKKVFDHIIEPPEPPEEHENEYEAWIYCEEHSMMNYISDHIKDTLFHAIEEGDFKTVQVLINEELNVNYEYYGKETPLMRAMKAKKNKYRITKFLIEKGADIYMKNYKNQTALELLIIPKEPQKSDKNAYDKWLKCDECLIMNYLNSIIYKDNGKDISNGDKSQCEGGIRPSKPN